MLGIVGRRILKLGDVRDANIAMIRDIQAKRRKHRDQACSAKGGRTHQGSPLRRPDLKRNAKHRDTGQPGFDDIHAANSLRQSQSTAFALNRRSGDRLKGRCSQLKVLEQNLLSFILARSSATRAEFQEGGGPKRGPYWEAPL